MRYVVCFLLITLYFNHAKGKQEFDPKDRLIVETLTRLNRFDLSENEKWDSAVQRYTYSQRGTDEYLDLVEKFNLRGEVPKIIEDLLKKPVGEYASRSIQIIFKFDDQSKLEIPLRNGSTQQIEEIVKLVGFIPSEEAREFVSKFNPKSKKINRQDDFEKVDIEDIPTLVNQVGSIKDGKLVYEQFCAVCHKAGNVGIDFGPRLTEISNKLPRSELYLAILKPNAGISFDYEGWTVYTKEGSVLNGILSESENEFTIRMIGGLTQIINKERILKKEKMKASLMPESLHLGMSKQDLVNLIEFLFSLKS